MANCQICSKDVGSKKVHLCAKCNLQVTVEFENLKKRKWNTLNDTDIRYDPTFKAWRTPRNQMFTKQNPRRD